MHYGVIVPVNLAPCVVPTGLDGLSDEDYAKKVFYVWFDACSR